MQMVVVAAGASVEASDGEVGSLPCALGQALHLGQAQSAAVGLGLL